MVPEGAEKGPHLASCVRFAGIAPCRLWISGAGARLGGTLYVVDDKARLHALAARQGGLLTRAQARACGYSMFQVRRRLAAGEWQHILGTVYTVRPARVTPQLRDAAALLAVPSGVLAGPSAARRLGIRVPDSGTYLWIGAGRRVGLPGVTYLRSPLPARDRWPAGDAVVTATGRTVFDCLLVLADADALNLLDDALRERWTSTNIGGRRPVTTIAHLSMPCPSAMITMLAPNV